MRFAHAYGICTPFYCINLKKYGGGYNAARGLISRDIANVELLKLFGHLEFVGHLKLVGHLELVGHLKLVRHLKLV